MPAAAAAVYDIAAPPPVVWLLRCFSAGMKLVFVSLCIGVACSIAVIAPSAGAVDTSRCASAGSTTVYKSSAGRIFKKRGHYYSCSYREGKKFRLAESGFTGEDRYGPFRIVNRFAAHAYRPSCGACESTGA